MAADGAPENENSSGAACPFVALRMGRMGKQAAPAYMAVEAANVYCTPVFRLFAASVH
jgi:hypothetical protein